MAKIDVKTSQMKGSAAELEMLAQQLKQLEAQIHSATRGLQSEVDSTGGIRRSINKVTAACEQTMDETRRLAASLREITARYEQVERQLLGLAGVDMESLREKIERLREEIGEIGGLLGMDPAAFFSDDPVNLSNGNYVYEKTFFRYDTVLDMQFRMFYNACGDQEGSLGRGWQHSFEHVLSEKDGEVRIRKEDGTTLSFRSDKSGRFVPFAGTFGTLRREGDHWEYSDEQQDLYQFTCEGKLYAVVSPDGWRMDLAYEQHLPVSVTCTDGIAFYLRYNEENRLAEVADHAGRHVRFAYSGGQLVQVEDTLGNTVTYEYDENGRMSRITAPNGDLSVHNSFDEDGRTVRQEFADGGVVEYLYGEEPDAVVMVRQNGSRVTYYHDSQARNTRTVYEDGEELTTYNDDHQKTSFTDKLGRINRYAYDAEGRLAQMVNALGVKMRFDYTPAGQLEQLWLNDELLQSAEYDHKGHQIKTVDANGAAVEFAYDELGRVLSVTHEDGSRTELEYDSAGNVVTVHDPVSGCTRYEYDVCRRVIATEDALGNRTRYEYDAADRLTRVTNAEGHSRVYTYDRRDNLIRVVDFNGGVTEIGYNNMNKPVRITDPDGNTTTFSYDLMSNVVRKVAPDGGVTEIGYDAQSRMTEIRHPMGGKETAQYDAVGNIIRRCAPDGGEYLIDYDALNRPVRITDPVGGQRSAEYDELGNVTAIHYEDGTCERFTYDRKGNCLSYTNQSGYCRRFRYSELGKILEVSDDGGVLVSYGYGPGGQLRWEKRAEGNEIAYFYDGAGNVLRVEDNVRGVWEFRYNALGRMCEANHVGEGTEYYEYDLMGNISAVTDGNGNKTSYRYSKAGALESVTDANGNEIRYEYDPCYRLRRILQPESGHFDADTINALNDAQKLRTTTYDWDHNGNVLSVTDSAGGRIAYSYDACDRIVRKQDQDDHVITCTYRGDGMQDILTFSDGRTIRHQYDALKRLSQVEDWLGITRLEHDAAGRLTRLTDPDGSSVDYRWNDRGQCTGLTYPDGSTLQYEYDVAARMSAMIGAGGRVGYDYYENGLLRSKDLGGAVSALYEYDAAGRIAQLRYMKDGVQADSYAYQYDACARKSRITEQHAGMPEQVFGFTYDPVGCLKEVTRNGQKFQSFTYDVFGNRSSMVSGDERTEYGYDPLGRLSWSRAPGVEKTYRYDKRGNLTGESVNGTERLRLHFDALNRLQRAVSTVGTADYTYNGLAMLTHVRREMQGTIAEERLVFDSLGSGNRLLARSAEQWETFAWDHEMALSCSAGAATYFLNDERMSTFGILQGGEIRRRTYDPFGVTDSSPDPAVPGFTGYRSDPITGYYDGGWRQYDPSSGRFVSQDPVAGTLMAPITLNPYLYCMADPINNLDPTGRIAVWLAAGIVGAVVNAGAKLAGDVVKSVKEGKPSFSSWQSYVGTAAGGFVSGTVLVVAGPAAAGAAGAATESLITGGLSMATGAEGYRKEDGYTVGTLLKDTAISTVEGAVTGFVFGAAAKHLKIPGITSGRGNASAVWKQVITKAQRGQIANVTTKTLLKGLYSYGLIKTVDTILDKGWEELKDYAKEKVKGYVADKIRELLPGEATPLMDIFFGGDATCQTA